MDFVTCLLFLKTGLLWTGGVYPHVFMLTGALQNCGHLSNNIHLSWAWSSQSGFLPQDDGYKDTLHPGARNSLKPGLGNYQIKKKMLETIGSKGSWCLGLRCLGFESRKKFTVKYYCGVRPSYIETCGLCLPAVALVRGIWDLRNLILHIIGSGDPTQGSRFCDLNP